jgi:preprotein translocase subunit SecY
MVMNNSRHSNEFTRNQKIVATIFYVLIVVASLVTLGGVVWTLADIFISPTEKWELFRDLNLGYQIAIVGGLLAGLFFLLVFFFGLFKKTSRSLIKFIYKKRELEEKYKNRTNVKIAAGGLIISLLGIIIGVIVAIILDLLREPSSDSFSLLNILISTGPLVLFIGLGLILYIGAALFVIYFWKNGYYLILKMLGILEKEEKDT